MENNNEVNNLEDENLKKEQTDNKRKNIKKICIKISVIIMIIIITAIVGIVVYAKILKDNYTNSEPFYTNNDPFYDPECPSCDKPIIYLYPEKETNVLVNLGNSKNITCSYPVYKETGWKVKANTKGELMDLDTGRNLYALYYESKPVKDFEIKNEGFIVKGIDTVNFLEEKLSILGLTERETEEFIIYWLPVLQENKYNYIRFASTEEINMNMPLNIDPNPDTIIRVLMTYKGLQEPIEVKEQELVTPERKGFTVVEWGGTEIK